MTKIAVWLTNIEQRGGRCGVLLSLHGVAGFLDGTLELLGAHLGILVAHRDGALLDVRVRALDAGELVQSALDGGLAVAAAHARYLQRHVGHPFSSLHPQEALDGSRELLYLLLGVLALLDRLSDAVLDVVLEQYGANLLKRRDDAGYLGQNVDAVGLLVHHTLHAPHLALDPLETVLEELFVLRLYVAVSRSLRGDGHVASLCCVHHFLLSLYLGPAQPQSVREYGYRGERHRGRRKHGVEKTILPEHQSQDPRHAPVGEEWVEDTGRYGDQSHVVGEGPEQVLLDVLHGGLGEPDRPRHPAYVT